jgi:Endonuclease-reverse transcriptase
MASVSLLFVNMRRRNAAMHSLLNSNKLADIILVQEPWHGKIGTSRSDVDPEGVDILGGAANPLWDCLYPKTNPGERCKVMAYRRISSTHFNITNRLDLHSNHHLLTLDVHLGTSSFRIINVYHDSDHRPSLGNITNMDIEPLTPTIIGGDFNTHSHTWSPPGIRASPWVVDLEEWAFSQNLFLTNHPGAPTWKGEGRQRDTTIDLIWTNGAAVLDDLFQDPIIDFAASEGSDHAGLRTTYRHIIESAIHPPAQPTRYIISDESRELWARRFIEDSTYWPADLITTDDIEAAAHHLTQDMEQTSSSTFEARKGYSPRGASWWDDSCDQAAATARNSQNAEDQKTATKALWKAVQNAKR